MTRPLQWHNSFKVTNLCLNVLRAFLLVSVSSLSNALSREPPAAAALFVFADFPAERREKINLHNKIFDRSQKDNKISFSDTQGRVFQEKEKNILRSTNLLS